MPLPWDVETPLVASLGGLKSGAVASSLAVVVVAGAALRAGVFDAFAELDTCAWFGTLRLWNACAVMNF
jgi:hypothetical protein